jgi:hypothetical protein
MGAIGLLAWVLLGGGPFDGLEDPASGVQEASVRRPPPPDTIPPVRIEARSEMGKRFRLIDAVFMLDGTQIAQMKASDKQAVDLAARALEVRLGRGLHSLTVILVYQGRSVGLFSYLDKYRFRAVASYAFYLEKADGQPLIRILARERAGATVPLEKKPMVEIAAPHGLGVTPMSGVNHGTEVTVVPVAPPSR